MWGTISLGFFATGEYGASTPTGADNTVASVVTGLFYGGGKNQLIAQVIGNLSIGAGVFIASLVTMYVLKAVGVLRVFREGKLEGLDVHEHGGIAYPEVVLKSDGAKGTTGKYSTPGALTVSCVHAQRKHCWDRDA